MKIIIHDFEVFKYDVLLGTIILDEDKTEIYQTWDKEEIKKFYNDNTNSLWVGHNNISYDEFILEGIIKDKDTYQISKSIVLKENNKKCKLPILMYDVMKGFSSLKTTEYAVGKNISETQVDFDINRPLTDEEKKLTESYNRDDLQQTLEEFNAQKDDFNLRLKIINEFKLKPSCLTVTGTQLAAIVLKSKQIKDIDKMAVETKLPKNLILKNQDVIDFYLNEDFRKNKEISINLCGCEHIIASGGIHAALRKVQYKHCLYFDVSGYYNLIMLIYDLLPRTISDEGKKLYEFMYHEQLRLKKINPIMRAAYKTILLSVFGGMGNEYTDFYDPWNGSLVTITGEMFLVDLLEKLEGKVQVVQSNTDGIMLDLFDWSKKDEVIKIVEDWEQRTGFVIKKEEIYNLWQRDVNNYVFEQDGEIHAKGEIVAAYNKIKNPLRDQLWTSKEPPIIAIGIINFLINGITPEETVKENKRNLIYYQYPCKSLSFDYCQYEEINTRTGENKTIKLQHVNRAFALNSNEIFSTVVKYKNENGKIKKSKVAGLPNQVFIYNDEILSEETINKLQDRINWNYYVDRIYQRLGEFVDG